MSTQEMVQRLEIALPASLYQWLSREAERRAQDVPGVIEALLEEYVRQYDLTQTRTWKLCGAFAVAEPEPEYLVGADEAGSPITNYAEHVDDTVYEEA